MEKLREKILAVFEREKITGDAYMEEIEKTEIQANNGAVEKTLKADSFGAGIRVFKNGKMGAGYFTVKDPGEAEKIIKNACDAAFIQGYENYKLPGQAHMTSLKLADPGAGGIGIPALKKNALFLEESAKTNPKVKFVRDTTVASVKSRVCLVNSNDAGVFYDKTYFYAYTSAVAVDGAAQEVADASEGSAKLSAINIEELGKDCSTRAAALLNGRPVASGTYDIIMPPYVAADFAALLSRLFLAGNIRKGKSLLCGKKSGDVIAAPGLTIRDDALLDYGAGSFPADAEGSQAANKAVVENGKLGTFLYDIINAGYMNAALTGNGVRQDFKSLPDCGPSNFYIAPGRGRCASESGILVNSLMGLHMTDTISGNFSLGINGWLVEKGDKKHSVRETLITGNIRDLLMKIDVICGDLKFYGNFGSPTLVARGVSVAGN